MGKIFIIAGEASGDLHGANLTKALLSLDPSLDIRAYGGSKMSQAGAKVVRSYEDNAFMGFYEVLINARKVLRNLKETTSIIETWEPDTIIFIDFPGFNLRVAKKLRNTLRTTKFYYYISPKVWAWKTNRIHTLHKLMDRILVIFPFEEAFYKKFGYEVSYVGNPLLDEMERSGTAQRKDNLIAVLPGSRRQEIEKMLPIFAQLSKMMPEYVFEVSVMPQFDLAFYRANSSLAGDNFVFTERTTYELLQVARVAVVTSGTATLETALLGTPQVVGYKTSAFSYQIGKRVIKTRFISLVNLILDREAVRELIQNELNPQNLYEELKVLIADDSEMLKSYEELRSLMGESGASMRAAKLILGRKE